MAAVLLSGVLFLKCQVDLHVLQGNLNVISYCDNLPNIHVVPHFDNHLLIERPIFMDDNTRPHGARIVRQFRQQEVIDKFQWHVMSPDMTQNRARIVLDRIICLLCVYI